MSEQPEPAPYNSADDEPDWGDALAVGLILLIAIGFVLLLIKVL